MNNDTRAKIAMMNDAIMAYFKDLCTAMEAYERTDHRQAEALSRQLLVAMHSRHNLLFSPLDEDHLLEELAKLNAIVR